MKIKLILIGWMFFSMVSTSCNKHKNSDSAQSIILKELPGISLEPAEFGKASVRIENDEMIISTGLVEGKWKWTGKGFVTAGFKNLKSGKEWCDQNQLYAADWDLRIFEGDVKLSSLKAEISDDDGFTQKHLTLIAEIDYDMRADWYPQSKLRLRFEIWAYPGAPGFRTQVSVKGTGAWAAPGIAESDDYRIDFMPLTIKGLTRQTLGYYNDHDGRNADSLNMVRNTIYSNPFSGNEEYPAANMVFLYNETGGIGLVKESHAVINKPGINTGSFKSDNNGIEATGWGLALANITREDFSPCWANWRICWSGDEFDKQLAVKMFDRFRYPLSDEDVVLTTNIWGGGQGAAGAKEENVLREIESSADLGIDVVQIDAGWEKEPVSDKPWEPSEMAYPDGWRKIMKLAEQKNVKLGIWNRGNDIVDCPEKLIRLNDAGFLYFKIDIGSWSTYDMLHYLITIVRDMEKHSNHKARVNWDVTHKGLRVGYLFGREYGDLFLQNRRLKMERDKDDGEPGHIYVPRRILKDEWRVADYLNLNQIMFNVQTTEFVNSEHSNARLYGDAYSFAIAMMSSPLFFTETWRYSPEDRLIMKELISIYKKYRQDLYQGYVFSIGELPNDNDWTGFQNFQPGKDFGFLTLFREINNTEPSKYLQLRFLKNVDLELENLLSGEKSKIKVDEQGYAEFAELKPASFKFFKYSIL